MKNTALVEAKWVVRTTPNFRKNHSFSKLFPCKVLIFRNTHFTLLFNIIDVFYGLKKQGTDNKTRKNKKSLFVIYFSNSTSPSINFQKLSAEEIFKIILLAPVAYKEKHLLKNIRKNKIYTIRDCTIESVTSDNNDAYYKSNGNKRMSYVETMQSNLTAKLVDVKNGIYFYKEKDGRGYANVEINTQDVYETERYYRYNKSISNLKRIIYRIKNMSTMLCNSFLCIVYTLHGGLEWADDIEILPQGNFKESNSISHRPYIRTDAVVLKRQEDLLSNNKSPQKGY